MSQKVDLYGGALTVKLPQSFISADRFRQIPDHQEVFITSPITLEASSSGTSPVALGHHASIIIEILTRAEPPAHPECTTDEAALKYHYNDFTETGHVRAGQEVEEHGKIWHVNSAIVESLGKSVPAYLLLGTQTPVEAGVINGVRTEFTAIWMLLVRLERVHSDILITVNLPHVDGEGYTAGDVDLAHGKEGRMISEARAVVKEILGSLEVVDWSMFDEE